MTNSQAMKDMFAEIDSKTNFHAEYRKAEPTEGAHVVTLKNVQLLPAKENFVPEKKYRDRHTGELIRESAHLIDDNQPPEAIIRPETLVFTFKDDVEHKVYTAFLGNYKLPDKLIKSETDPATLWDKFMDSLAEQDEQFLMLPMSGLLQKIMETPFTIWTFKDREKDVTRTVYNKQDFEYYTVTRPATVQEKNEKAVRKARKTSKA